MERKCGRVAAKRSAADNLRCHERPTPRAAAANRVPATRPRMAGAGAPRRATAPLRRIASPARHARAGKAPGMRAPSPGEPNDSRIRLAETDARRAYATVGPHAMPPIRNPMPPNVILRGLKGLRP